jgi:protein required for attachment to host cells
MKKAKLWYVIADGGRARFVEQDERGAFRTVSNFVSTELHKRSEELGRDRPARVQESASAARHAVEPKRDLHEAAKEDFLRTVGVELAELQKNGQFDELVLVAPPGAIRELKDALTKAVTACVVKELHKDLTKVPDHDLDSHFSE